MVKNAKTLRKDAERACEWYAREVCKCVITRRSIQTQFQKVDFFGCDCVGKTADGGHVYIQVTAGQTDKVTERKKKLNAIPWHTSDRVMILQLVQTVDPANPRRKKFFFRRYSKKYWGTAKEWITDDKAMEIPRHWFKAWKEDK
jgi:hypothetical protein